MCRQVQRLINNDGESQLQGVQSQSDLQDAIYTHDEQIFNRLSGKQITQLATHLSWDDYEFTRTSTSSYGPKATILEEVNNTTLSVLAPDGTVYRLGDTIEFETTTSSTWSSTGTTSTRSVKSHIDFLGTNTASVSRLPTYSNSPRSSPTATFGRTDIEVHEQGNLQTYRDRLTEGTNIDIPTVVNGWELVETKTRSEESVIPGHIITKMQWCNGESTYITAQWRGGYHRWWLSIPESGILTDENVDEYLYEIDVPQCVVQTSSILGHAIEAMRKLDPSAYQDPYDLRAPEDNDLPADRYSGPPPVDIPSSIGDWQITDRRKQSITWENRNTQSPWNNFTVQLDFHGGTKIVNTTNSEIHDQRLVEKYTPNGTPFTDNIDADYENRRRDMFTDNWYYSIAFMLQTSKHRPDKEKVSQINKDAVKAPTDVRELNHQLNTNPHITMDGKDGNLFAY
jgi:hypothetical protein